jgi:hypothetical protein
VAQYRAAAQVEYDGHLLSGTWELVPKGSVPKGKNILRGKWVFDDKRGEDGQILKFKARFVAMGFTQKEGVDYTETFAGVVVAKSFRIMLCILNEDPSYEMEHWDVRMATLDEELYMHQPELFEIDGEEKICRLKKSLYGLKQAARNWQQMLLDIFRETGFLSLKADPCVLAGVCARLTWMIFLPFTMLLEKIYEINFLEKFRAMWRLRILDLCRGLSRLRF